MSDPAETSHKSPHNLFKWRLNVSSKLVLPRKMQATLIGAGKSEKAMCVASGAGATSEMRRLGRGAHGSRMFVPQRGLVDKIAANRVMDDYAEVPSRPFGRWCCRRDGLDVYKLH